MKQQEKEQYLIENGWEQWYNPNYWVHPKTISDPKSQDYTMHGMSLDKAYLYEKSHEND